MPRLCREPAGGRAAPPLLLLLLAGAARAARPLRPATPGAGGAALGCLNGAGQPVDRWVVLKANSGSDYSYLDADGKADGFAAGPGTLAETDNALGHTLQQVYAGGDDVGYLMYNDQDPREKKSYYKAHAKGVYGWGPGGGFWLVHSTPRFPNFVEDGYQGFPEYAMRYGQSFLCTTFDLGALDDVARGQISNDPMIYDFRIPAPEATPTLASLTLKHTPDKGSQTLAATSAGGANLTVFAKNRSWDDYLYEDLVCETFDRGFRWETWMNGVRPDPTFCRPDHKYDSVNIRTVRISPAHEFKETQDHSKWGVSIEPAVVCIGDINRQESQNKRGGGTVCITDDDLWKAFDALVGEMDQC